MNESLKKLIRKIIPLPVRRAVSKARARLFPRAPGSYHSSNSNPDHQNLDVYWSEDMAKVLEEWGVDNAWNEIQLLMAACKGKVLDIACGTGKTIDILKGFTQVEIHGCDISDLLLQKAMDRGIPKERLKLCDATRTDYPDNYFDFSYSIGSLEHFTEEGIELFIKESLRITGTASFHMVPVSRNNIENGWITTVQSYFNNSEAWWYEKFRKDYRKVIAVPSKWEDYLSFGRWYLCFK